MAHKSGELGPEPAGMDGRNITAPPRPGQQDHLSQRLARTLLPTPLAGDATGGRTTKGKGRQAETGLRRTMARLMGPTPTSSDAKGGRTGPPPKSGTRLTNWLLPTATRADAKRAGNFGRGDGNPTLPRALRDWRSAKGMKPRGAHALNLPEYLANRWSRADHRASSRRTPSAGPRGRTGGGTGRSGPRSRR